MDEETQGLPAMPGDAKRFFDFFEELHLHLPPANRY